VGALVRKLAYTEEPRNVAPAKAAMVTVSTRSYLVSEIGLSSASSRAGAHAVQGDGDIARNSIAGGQLNSGNVNAVNHLKALRRTKPRA
jgi:hypothetical protein